MGSNHVPPRKGLQFTCRGALEEIMKDQPTLPGTEILPHSFNCSAAVLACAAEHAVKPFAELRHIIGGVTTEKSLRDYLVLLSLCATCKYIGVDFLDFLRSSEKDIHAFADSRARTKTTLRSGKIALPTQ